MEEWRGREEAAENIERDRTTSSEEYFKARWPVYSTRNPVELISPLSPLPTRAASVSDGFGLEESAAAIWEGVREWAVEEHQPAHKDGERDEGGVRGGN